MVANLMTKGEGVFGRVSTKILEVAESVTLPTNVGTLNLLQEPPTTNDWQQMVADIGSGVFTQSTVFVPFSLPAEFAAAKAAVCHFEGVGHESEGSALTLSIRPGAGLSPISIIVPPLSTFNGMVVIPLIGGGFEMSVSDVNASPSGYIWLVGVFGG